MSVAYDVAVTTNDNKVTQGRIYDASYLGMTVNNLFTTNDSKVTKVIITMVVINDKV